MLKNIGLPGVEWIAMVPEITMVVGIQVFVVYGVWWSTQKPYPILSSHMIRWISILLISTAYLIYSSPIQNVSLFEGAWMWDNQTRIIQLIVIFLAIITIIIGKKYCEDERINAFEWSLLMATSVIGIIGMISSQNFLGFYLILELQSFCFYILAASRRNSVFSTEASLKYFVLGALASGFLLFGAALCYGVIGTLSWSEMATLSPYLQLNPLDLISENNLDVGVSMEKQLGWNVGLLFVWFGLLFKLSAFPFHVWTPDVYEGSPTPITAFFALVPKLSVLYVLLKWLNGPFFGQLDLLQPLLFFVAVGSLIVGAFGALAQRNIKRLLAFSTIGHIGFICIGMATGSLEGISSSLFYLWVYTVISIGTFALVLGTNRYIKSNPRESLLKTHSSMDLHPSLSLHWLEQKRPGKAWKTGLGPVFYSDNTSFSSFSDLAPMKLNQRAEQKDEDLRVWLRFGSYGQVQRVQSINDLGGYAKINPVLGMAWMILFFSMAGVPPLAGFWSKYVVFTSVVASGWYVLTLIAVLLSVVSAFYYLRVIKTVYFPSADRPSNVTSTFYWPISKFLTILLGISLIFIVTFILDSSSLLSFASISIPSYFH
jgi:NADH-quinone oxidoreductase subunit N